MLIQTPLGRVIQQIVVLSLVIASFLALLLLYRALATTTSEIVWLRWLLADFGISSDAPTPLLCDNTGAIQIANDPVKHEITKHIGVDASFTRSHCHQKTIALQYVPSEMQLADFFHQSTNSRAASTSVAQNSMLQILRVHLEFEGGC